MALTGTFDYFRQGVPLPALQGRVDLGTLDYFRVGVPAPMLAGPAVITATRTVGTVRVAVIVTYSRTVGTVKVALAGLLERTVSNVAVAIYPTTRTVENVRVALNVTTLTVGTVRVAIAATGLTGSFGVELNLFVVPTYGLDLAVVAQDEIELTADTTYDFDLTVYPS